MKTLSQTLTSLFLTLALPLHAAGQVGDNMRDIEYLRSSQPWLSSSNAAGLSEMPINRIATAEGFFSKHNGGLAGIEESANSLEAGISTEAFVKASERVTLYGNLSYSYFSGKDMGGPIFMNPSYNPINFYESSETTIGTKNRELYNLIGGVSYSINDKWSIGTRFDYETGDQAKLKDPRILNVWMDLGVSAGVRFKASEKFSIGLNLLYERTLEAIKGGIYGTTDKQYFTYVDYGGFYGSRETFEGRIERVAVGETRPMFNSFYGGSLQLEAGKETRIFNEFTFLMRNGYYGKRSSTTVTFTEHSSNIIEYKGVLTTEKGSSLHRVGLDFRYEGLANNENIYRMNTELGDYTKVEYFGQNEILQRTDINGSLSYTGYLGVDNYRPKWEYGLKAVGQMRNSVTTIYPFYRTTSITSVTAHAHGRRNIIIGGKNMITIGLDVFFATGFGNPKLDGSLASSTSEAPRSMDFYLNRDFEYKTCTQAGGLITCRYTRFFRKVAAYIEANESYNLMLKQAEYLSGNNRNIFDIKIGCTF